MPRTDRRIPLLAVLALSGCMTQQQWSQNPVHERSVVYKSASTDQIRAVGITREPNAQIPGNSLVMAGERYWYVWDAQTSQQLVRLLNAGLKKPYQINSGTGHSNEITVTLQNDGQFRSSVCLNYRTGSTAEQTELAALQFTRSSNGSFIRCLPAKGRVYQPQAAQTGQPLARPLTVRLQSEHTGSRFNGGNLAGNLLMTPVSLIMDAAGAVLTVPPALF